MTKHVLLVTLLQLSITSFSQNFIWSKNIGSNGNDGGNSIKVDADENILSCGYFYETIDFDPGPEVNSMTSEGSADIYVIKQNSNGDLLWARTFGSTGIDRAYSLVYDEGGNVYITGHFFGTVDFDPGVGTQLKTSHGQHDIFLLKLSSEGDLVWIQTIGGSETDYGRALTIGQDGQICLTGFYSETVDFDPGVGNTIYSATTMQYYDVFITKFSTDGNLIWAKSIGGTGMEDSFSIATNESNEVYITGFFEATADFNPSALSNFAVSNGAYDIFILKLDSDGNYIWNKTIGGTGNDIGRSILADANGNIVISGIFSENMDADPSDSIMPFISAGFSDAFVIQMDSEGNLNWALPLGGIDNDEAKSVSVDFEGNYYVSGWFGSTIEIDSQVTSGITAVGAVDIFVQKLHQDGSLAWIQTLGGTSVDYANSVTCDGSGSIYITGSFSESADFDPGSEAYSMNSNGGSDIYLTKLCYALLPQDIISGSAEVCHEQEAVFQYIDSPYLVNYTWSLPEGATLVSGQNSSEARFVFTQPVNQILLTTQNACGMTYEASIEVLSHEFPEISIDAYPGTTLCSGETLMLTATGASNITWEDGIINGENFVASESREYIVEATNGPNCTTTAAIAIEVEATPQIIATANLTTVCGNGEVILAASGADEIAWAEGIVSGEPVSITETRTFHAMAMSPSGCLGAAEITIEVHPLPVIDAHASNSNICHGNNVTLFATGADNFIWSNGISDNEPVTLNQTTTFTVATTDEFGCTGYDDITVIVHQAPEIIANATATEICHGSSITLSGSGGENFQWSNGVNDNQPFNLFETTTFTLNGMSEYGCIGEAEITINVHEIPVITEQPSTITSTVGDDIYFEINTEFPADTYRWQRSNGTGFENIENDAVFSGVGSPILQISNAGAELDGNQFRCILTSGPCVEFSDVASLTMTPDGVEEVEANLIQVYPNPASGMITLAVQENLIGMNFQIFDQTGRMMLEEKITRNVQQIELYDFASGLYTLHLAQSSQKPTRFVVK